ncbi:hypothetical protein MNEG_14948, partial [Monoraphidium neglectum]
MGSSSSSSSNSSSSSSSSSSSGSIRSSSICKPLHAFTSTPRRRPHPPGLPSWSHPIPCACCSYVESYEDTDPSTYKGLNLRAMTMAELYTYYGLDAQTVDFIGHALALHRRVTEGVAG